MNVRIRVGPHAGKEGPVLFCSQRAFGVTWKMAAVTFMLRRRPVTVVLPLEAVEHLDGSRPVSARDACC